MEPVLRLAGPDDAGTVLDFIRDLAAYQRAPDAVETTAEDLRDQLAAAHPPFECLLVEHEGRPRGMALYFPSYSTWRGRAGLYLEDLFVEEAARGRGLGLALFRGLAGIAAERGYARIEWSVKDWNAPSVAFYEALGARPQRGETVYRLDGQALAALQEPE